MFELPALRKLVRNAQGSGSGNVFVGDLKPERWSFTGTAFARSRRQGIREVYRLFDQIFPGAIFVWLIRHPHRWITSISHWESETRFSTPNKSQSFLLFWTKV